MWLRAVAGKTLFKFLLLVFLVGTFMVSGQPDYPQAVWNPAYKNNYTTSNREETYDIRWIIIHVAEGSYSGTISWFKNPQAKVSAHYVVKMDGSEITQMVRDKDVAWHAGNWAYNTRSIGIEIEGYVGVTRWPDSMYDALAKLVAWLAKKYKVEPVHPKGVAPANPESSTGIIGHNQVPDPNNPRLGGGKSHHSDPGSTFDWDKFMKLVRKYYYGSENVSQSTETSTDEGEGFNIYTILAIAGAFTGLAVILVIVYMLLKSK
ncbi:MAG: N-acetylmuramoyl-L-alanine amidase [Thermoproteales archaeon]|nr:N-acetylmuramoyl-L-alanine amidase [Thermoproteales archaeon]